MIDHRIMTIKRRMPFGRYAGQELRTLKRTYLNWVINVCDYASTELKADCKNALAGLPYDMTEDERVSILYGNESF